MARATSSGTITFGLVSLPFKLYTANKANKASFKQINKNTNNPVKQKLVDEVTRAEVGAEEIQKGFEHQKNSFVVFSPEEIKALESDRSNTIDVEKFVDIDELDLIFGIEKSSFLGPDKGGDKAYLLFSKVLEKTGKVAIGSWAARGKDHLVAVRAYNGGLIMHQLFYSNEIRSFGEVKDKIANISFQDRELDMAEQLVNQLSGSFDLPDYADSYVQRVHDAVQAKLAGGEIATVEVDGKAKVPDLFAALQASLTPKAKPEAKAKSKTKRASKRKAG